jgi:Reverse transcriptase (RNA-dependent DNA polymerase)
VSFGATNDPDTLYYHEILREPDKDQFIKAMRVEIQQHNDRKNWILVRRDSLPQGTRVLPSVWALRRKRDITTGQIVKWKGRINVNGSKQQPGIDFEQTFAPVASWASVRLIVLLAVINKWITKQLDFVQAFPQAPVESQLFMEIPKRCHVSEGDGHWVLEILNNIYGQRQAGKVWYDFLTKGLIQNLGFKQSEHDPCILWRGTCIIIIIQMIQLSQGQTKRKFTL